ncbi:hypothetical protein ACOMHN_059434 [Nucella lapillus]
MSSVELARYKVAIAALSDTRFADKGQLTETGGGYTFFWSRRSSGVRREHLSAEVAALAAPKESLYTEVADFGALCYQSSGAESLAAAFFALVSSLRNDRVVLCAVEL